MPTCLEFYNNAVYFGAYPEAPQNSLIDYLKPTPKEIQDITSALTKKEPKVQGIDKCQNFCMTYPEVS
jgi:hypothetical protein